MSLHQYLLCKFAAWKPPPPAVESRTSRDITLALCAGPYSCLGKQLLYRVEKKEKIPPWIVVYSGGKTTKTIVNLAPCHPHRFRLRVIIKSDAVPYLAESLIDHYGDEETVRAIANGPDELEDQERSYESDSRDNNAACARAPLSTKPFEHRQAESIKERSGGRWLESAWSEETCTNTESDGASAVGFCMAVRCGYLKQVQQMLEERPQLLSVVNCNNGYTPLATAVRKGDVNMVKFLVSANAGIEQRSCTGQTPLHLAVLSGHVAVADLLLEKGADFQARDFNELRAEHYAVDSCKLDVLKFVLDRGGDVNVLDSNGWTPLFRAVCQGAKTEVIEELVRRGSDVEVTDRAQLALPAAARLLKDRHGRRRESVLRLVDPQYQHEKVVANFTRLTKKISSVHTLFKN